MSKKLLKVVPPFLHVACTIVSNVNEIVPHKKEDIMTSIAQEYENKGMQNKALEIAKNMLSTLHLDIQDVAQQLGEKYKQQGMQQERLHLAKNMLSVLHLDVEIVAQATGLSREELMKLQADTNR